METAPVYPSVQGMLRVLSGGVLDFAQLETDSEGLNDFVRFQQKLWEVELTVFSPAPVFSAAWDHIDPSPEDTNDS